MSCATREAPAEEEIQLLAAQIHAATARLCSLAANYDAGLAWANGGFRTSAHWLTVNAGFGLRTSSELVRVGNALECLPRIAAAFAAGRLSFDKVRAVTHVASADDEQMWLDVALHASGSQLARICRAVRSVLDVHDPRRADDELAHRGVRRWWRDDGMLEILAVLPREDGAVVMAALDAVAKDLVAERLPLQEAGTHEERLSEPALRADALTRICEQRIATDSPEPVVSPTRQMVIHVDASVLLKRDESGRSHIEDGAWLSPASARWLGCDSDIVAIVERDGTPLDVGRAKRVISPRMRLALQARDRGCRFPGCGVPASRTEGHHIRHWLDHGPTELENLISLCRFHHRRHHEGKFDIRVLDDGDFAFERSDGTAICLPEPVAASSWLPSSASMAADTPRAISGGEPCDFEHAIYVLANTVAAGHSP